MLAAEYFHAKKKFIKFTGSSVHIFILDFLVDKYIHHVYPECGMNII